MIDGFTPVTVRTAAGTQASLDLTQHATTCLFSKRIKERLISQTGKDRHNRSRFISEVSPSFNREDMDAPVSQPFQGRMHLRLVSPQAVLRFDDNCLEISALCGFEQQLVSGTLGGRAGDFLVRKDGVRIDLTAES
jgi:hypothetical protein